MPTEPQKASIRKTKPAWYSFAHRSLNGKFFTLIILNIIIASGVLGFSIFGFSTLSHVRAYVYGEGIWSKAQISAVESLLEYIETEDSLHYYAFQEQMRIPLGDRKARLELDKETPDLDQVYYGFLEGGNAPEDIEGLISLYLNFHDFFYLKKCIHVWAKADGFIVKLRDKGEEVHRLILAQEVSPKVKHNLLVQIRHIDHILRPLADEFSATLGEASIWMTKVFSLALMAMTIGLGALFILITYHVITHISKGLREVSHAAQDYSRGSFENRLDMPYGDEIGDLGRSFNAMADDIVAYSEELKKAKEAAEAGTKAKAAFLSAMSHEIRTPMNGIIGVIEVLNKCSSTPQQKAYLDVLMSSSDALMHLLNEILDLNKMESGKMAVEKMPFDLQEFIYEVFNVFKHAHSSEEVGLKINIDSNASRAVVGDVSKIRQVLNNLLSNALKFTSEGCVELSIILLSDSSDYQTIRFEVKDTGIGVSPEQEDHIFDDFTQADMSTSRLYGGSGLGLSICKKLIMLMGGKMGVDSQLTIGSCFWFELALEKRKEGRGEKDSNESAHELEPVSVPQPMAQLTSQVDKEFYSQPKLKVLVVEDDATNQLALESLILDLGYDVDLANDGLVALDQYQKTHYDLIITDMKMPGMGGVELAHQIRQIESEKGGFTPIFALTGSINIEDKEMCLKAGMDEILSKPIKIASLSHLIAQYISPGPNEVSQGKNEVAKNDVLCLIVEDNGTNQLVLSSILQQLGFISEIAENGQIGFEKAAQNHYDIIFMDLRMPVLNGHEACKKIRELHSYKDIPIIAVTANTSEYDQEEARASGMNGFLSKPVKRELIENVMKKFKLSQQSDS
ncbi:MAG: response regulator [Planctomycetes bacterium]|nr:response regulator [Planctomycetota bacterium]